jgi:ABC-type phosphate transport system substrate-binding protein
VIRIFHLAFILVLGFSNSAVEAADLVVIVSARTSLTVLRADQVADIFLSQTSSFPDGSEAVAVDQKLGSPLRDQFYDKVAHRSPALMKAYWTKLIFTGRGQPPTEVDDNAAMRKLVADTPGMVGYIERAALDPSVRAVLIVR